MAFLQIKATAKNKHTQGNWAAGDTNRRRTIANKLGVWAPSSFTSQLYHICISGQAEGRLCIRLLQNVLEETTKAHLLISLSVNMILLLIISIN